jgi:hypothetical protein
LSTLFDKFIFEILANFVGNLSAMFYLALVASNNGTPTIKQRYKMKTKLELPKEIEMPTADLWLSTGAVTITDIGEENTYYANEFGHLFFCKNYPSHDCQAQIYI